MTEQARHELHLQSALWENLNEISEILGYTIFAKNWILLQRGKVFLSTMWFQWPLRHNKTLIVCDWRVLKIYIRGNFFLSPCDHLPNFYNQDVLAKLAAKFLERSEAKAAEEAAELSAIEVKKRSERLQKIEASQRQIHRSQDERYHEINRALLLSEVGSGGTRMSLVDC